MTAREERRASRSDWPVRVFRLGREPGADLSAATTAEQRLEMVWQLTLEAWSLTGRPLPDYARDSMPVAVRRLGGGKGDRRC